MMTECGVTSPTSTTSSSPEAGNPRGKMTDKHNSRKSSKPLMERKRRARINQCLGQLKSLVLQAMQKDNSQYSKLEKADILELTVKHLKQVQQMQCASARYNQIPEAVARYRAGFNECANEVVRYIGESPDVNSDARSRILSHLSTVLSSVRFPPLPSTTTTPPQEILPAPLPAHQPHRSPLRHNMQQQQQRQQNPQIILQQQQQFQQQQHQQKQQHDLLQQRLQTELVQSHSQHQRYPDVVQQTISVLRASERDHSPIVIDYNNNSNNNNNNNNNPLDNNNNNNLSNVNNNNNMQNRNISAEIKSSGIVKVNNLNSIFTSNVNQSQGAVTSAQLQQQLLYQHQQQQILGAGGAMESNQALNISSTTPLFPVPVTMATTPFQLVHSTLPNGQLALVLAPQQVPSMNVYAPKFAQTQPLIPKEFDSNGSESPQKSSSSLSSSTSRPLPASSSLHTSPRKRSSRESSSSSSSSSTSLSESSSFQIHQPQDLRIERTTSVSSNSHHPCSTISTTTNNNRNNNNNSKNHTTYRSTSPTLNADTAIIGNKNFSLHLENSFHQNQNSTVPETPEVEVSLLSNRTAASLSLGSPTKAGSPVHSIGSPGKRGSPVLSETSPIEGVSSGVSQRSEIKDEPSIISPEKNGSPVLSLGPSKRDGTSGHQGDMSFSNAKDFPSKSVSDNLQKMNNNNNSAGRNANEEDELSVRQLFEHKMGKRRADSNPCNNGSMSAWRPW